MKKSIIVQLSGGLGNQMFQYATARALATRSNVEIALDTWSGFVRDFRYNRSYELGPFSIFGRIATPFECLPFWLDRLKIKFYCRQFGMVRNHWYGDVLKETKKEFLPKIAGHAVLRRTWMIGYWQSPKYFETHASTIQQELMPSEPTEEHFVELGQKMRSKQSVAVGVRLYEESCNPEAHAADGKLKSVEDIDGAALKIANLVDTKLHFFVFCTHRASFIERLSFPGNVTYVTHDDGFKDTLNCLWLLTQCRHHIITNSSFYWWGAWLSSVNYKTEQSEVFAADNFINRDSILPHWHLF